MLNKFRINSGHFKSFLCFALLLILVYIIALVLYVSMPGSGEYKVLIFDRCVLMLEYIVCAFTAVVVFLACGHIYEKRVK